MKRKDFAKANNYAYAAALVVVAVVISAVVLLAGPNSGQPNQVACTMDAKICPDGSAVGRTVPNCEFAPCPTDNSNCTCPQGYVKDGLACNPACYYSTPKCLAPSFECSPTR